MLVLSRAHCLGAVVAGLSSCRLRRDSSVGDADDSIGPDQKVLSSAVVSYRHLLLLVPLDVDQLLLVKHLESDYKLRSFLSCQVHVPKLSSTHGLTDFEILDFPLIGVEFSDLLSLNGNL